MCPILLSNQTSISQLEKTAALWFFAIFVWQVTQIINSATYFSIYALSIDNLINPFATNWIPWILIVSALGEYIIPYSSSHHIISFRFSFQNQTP